MSWLRTFLVIGGRMMLLGLAMAVMVEKPDTSATLGLLVLCWVAADWLQLVDGAAFDERPGLTVAGFIIVALVCVRLGLESAWWFSSLGGMAIVLPLYSWWTVAKAQPEG